MAYALGLPDALRRRGLTVETVPGWETRSAGSFAPRGAICHWTAGPANSKTRPSLNIVVNGRPDLDGPLANVYLDRNGVAVVCAAGRANHGGAGTWRGVTGNSSFFGTEAEAAGPSDFTAAQRDAYPRVNAAYCDLGKFGAEMVCGHSEYATPKGRKTDINGYTMDAMRAQVAAILKGEADMPLTDDDIRRIWEHQINSGKRVTSAEVMLAAADSFVTDAVPVIVSTLLDASVDRPDGRGPTSLRAMLAWNDNHVDAIIAAISGALTGVGPVDASAIAEQVRTAIAAKLASLKFTVNM